jgi:dienelactone hydrolase
VRGAQWVTPAFHGTNGTTLVMQSDFPMIRRGFLASLLCLVGQAVLMAQDAPLVRFDLEALAKLPEIFPADDLQVEGVKAFFYQGLPFKRRPTRIFAYYGLPTKNEKAPDEKLPAMVLIHGGGGSAFDRWVKVWNSRGYAAIAMDLCGCVPVGTYGNWKRHEHGGPMGWDASFEQLNDPIEDQWTFQATSAAILAQSLLRSYPEIDAERIGVTGISWGGYLTCVVAGVDSRFKFAAPVYGCGFLGENSAWLPAFENLGPDLAGLWLRQWDPSVYLPNAKMPMLWVNGTNDFAYPMDSWKKSYLLPTASRDLCLRVRMPHGHGPAGENPEEIRVFADSILRNGKPLAKITGQGQTNNEAWATYKSEVPITKAELNFTLDTGRWQDRKWELSPATIDAATERVSAQIPADAKVYYLNLFDDRNCAVSTQHIEK